MEYDFYVHLAALSRIFCDKCADGRRLIGMFGNISEIFTLSGKDLRSIMPGAEKIIGQLTDRSILDWAEKEVKWAESQGVRLLYVDEPGYPYRLRECEDAPLMLYCKGKADLDREHVLAVVGTRRATYYGRTFCRSIIENLAACGVNPLIASGLALGIDGCAHQAALDSGLETVAVLPCALDTVYPGRHRELAEAIAQNGALLSDFSRGTPIMVHTFIRRNRIIAGLADAVLLAESFKPGGGLITASLANSYSREVFAVPGRNTDESFVGCNSLIAKNEAALVDSADTLARAMGWMLQKKKVRQNTLFDDLDSEPKKRIAQALRQRSPQSVEELFLISGVRKEDFASILLEMEVAGVVTGVGGGRYGLR